MRICLVARSLAPTARSGVGRATWGLARGLADDGHRVHVVTRARDASPAGLESVALEAFAVPPLLGLPQLADEPAIGHLAHAAGVHRAVAGLHEREGVDVVLAPLWTCEGAVCLLDGRFPTAVSCMTSMTTIRELDPVPPTREEEQLVALERSTITRARYLHGLTRESLDKTLADYAGDPSEMAVVGRGLPDLAGTGPALKPSSGGPVRLLFVGRLERRKGVDTLLAAARELTRAGVEFDLTLAGPHSDEASYRADFESEAGRDPALAARVRFAGAVSDRELLDLYRRADVVCAPSRYESHGVVLVEAMMFGRSLVACAAGGVPSVLEDGGNALLVPPEDPAALAGALRRMVADPELRARMGARSRALYEERFTAAEVAARMSEFLARVVADHRPEPTGSEALSSGLATLIAEVLGSGSELSATAAAELLAPPTAAWRQAAEQAERERSAWQARAREAERQVGEWRERSLEAERQSKAAADELRRAVDSRSWRLTKPLRRAAALRRARRSR